MFIKDNSLDFESHTGQNKIQPLLYIPDSEIKVKAFMLIVHGMAEHQLRYKNFAKFLCSKGFVICTLDLPGHGMTAPDEKHLGYFAEFNGGEKILLDIDFLMNRLMEKYPDLPAFILGHSMGSMIVRQFCATTTLKINGAIFSGTVAPNPLAGIATWLAARSMKKNGGFYRDLKLDHLMNKDFQAKISNPASDFDWISHDTDIVKAYNDDPLCGFVFTANGFYNLFYWTKQVSSKKWAEKIPLDVPLFIFSGDQDPVGNYGAGVRKIVKWLQDCGHKPDLTIYEGGRHEMLNETNKQKVWADICNWLDKIIVAID